MTIETEQHYLGSLLIALSKQELPDIRLSAADFSDHGYRRIFETILLQLADPTIRVPDLLTLSRALPDLDPTVMASLTDGVISDANIAYYETELLTERKRQRFMQDVHQALEQAQLQDADVDAVIGGLAERLTAAASATEDRNRYAAWEAYLTECTAYDPAKDFSLFQEVRCPNGTLSYIGARPGGGKTTLLINLVRDAFAQGRRVFFVNLEMSNKQILTNLTLSLMYAAYGKALDTTENPLAAYYGLFKPEGAADPQFVTARREAMDILAQAVGNTLCIYDGIGTSLSGLLLSIQANTQPGDVVLLDYVQRLPVTTNLQRYLEIKAGSNALLQLAIRHNLVVIAGAQLNRKAEAGETSLADFREGGDIEADAHNALAIEGNYIHILKAREGSSGRRIALEWNKAYCYMQTAGTYTAEKQAPPAVPAQKKRKGAKGRRDYE